MKNRLNLIAISILLVTSGIAFSGNEATKNGTAETLTSAIADLKSPSLRPYNSTFNPRQKEYPSHLGFNDLHIQAVRHLPIKGAANVKSRLNSVVHHHCKAYDDGTLVCLMFHSGMKDNDKPIGFEYIIPTAMYNGLSETEKKHWHYHKDEVPLAKATFPDLTAEEAQKLLPAINETYGKVIYMHQPDTKLPLGEPYILDVHSMPHVD